MPPLRLHVESLLVAFLSSATPRRQHPIAIADAFYPDAHKLCGEWARLAGITLEQATAVTALCSINQGWRGNVTLADRIMRHGRISGLPFVVSAVKAILHGHTLDDVLGRGSKVRNFQRSILLLDSCTNDRWSFRAFNRPQGETWYEWVTRATKILAAEIGQSTYTTQSRIWHSIIVDYAARGDRGAIASATQLGLAHIVARRRVAA